jgi:NADPH-dependent ferric siderophore reductase
MPLMTSTTPAARARRHPPELWRVPVLRTERVTPAMARITVGGPALTTFPGDGRGDQHVVLYFYEPDVVLPDPLTLTSARTLLGQVRPAMRSYTVRRYDPVGHELDIDFVLHADGGVANDWAMAARPGDHLIVVGPSPAYLPDPDVPAHILLGDETALPAIGAMLAHLPASADVTALIEIADPAEEQALGDRVTWLHRAGRPAGRADQLLDALRSHGPLTGRAVAVWAAGERTVMQAVRAYLVDESGLDRKRVRTTMYWRLGHTGGTG